MTETPETPDAWMQKLGLEIRLHRKQAGLTQRDLVEYFGRQRLGLTTVVLTEELEMIRQAAEQWTALIEASFLPHELKAAFGKVVEDRCHRVWA